MIRLMEMIESVYEPLQYDEERLKQLYYGKMMPKAYRPKGRVNKAAFADAMIGLYLDSLESKRGDDSSEYTTGLARAAFTISFLQGAPAGDLKEMLTECSDSPDDIRDSRKYALDIVDVAIQHLVRGGVDGIATTDTLSSSVEPAIEAAREIDVRDFQDVVSVIHKLYEQHRLPHGEAQVLLVLLRQARSPLSLERQVEVIEKVLPYIKGRVRRSVAMQPHLKDELQDKSFATGSSYIKTILDNPSAMLTDERILIGFAQTELLRNDALTKREASRQVLGHIGYALETIYPVRQTLARPSNQA